MIHVEEGRIQVKGNLPTVCTELHLLLYSFAKDNDFPITTLQTVILNALEDAYKHV